MLASYFDLNHLRKHDLKHLLVDENFNEFVNILKKEKEYNNYEELDFNTYVKIVTKESSEVSIPI